MLFSSIKSSCACAVFWAALSVLYLFPALAYDTDTLLEEAGGQCTRQAMRSERNYGIPLHLLGAIAATESGRRHQGLQMQVPWPWTINVEGTPYIYYTKREAVEAVLRFQSQGISSIDVGCMQVNLRHHPAAFTSLEDAFDPRHNVDYAARYLRSHYDETGSWRDAVGRYHSRTEQYARVYISKVYTRWHQLASRVPSEQQRTRYTSYIRSEGSGQQVTFTQGVGTSVKTVARKPANPSVESGGAKVAFASESSPSVRIIRVNNPASAASGQDMAMIQPVAATAGVQQAPVAQMADGSGPLVIKANDRRVRVEREFAEPGSLSVTRKEGEDPRFIHFSN